MQNAFPTLEKYVDHVHIRNGKPLKISIELQKETESLFRELMGLKNRQINLFFTDIDKLKEKMLEELKISNKK